MRQYLPDVTVADKAPDAGVKVTVGEPRVVMWAPEGKTADIAGEKNRQLRPPGSDRVGDGRPLGPIHVSRASTAPERQLIVVRVLWVETVL